MTKTVAEQIIEVIEYLGQKFGIVIDWSAQNLLSVAEHLGDRIVVWQIASNLFWMLFVLSGIIGIKLGYKWYLKARENDLEASCMLLIIVSIVTLCICIPGFFVSVYELIKCFAFPEIVILEYIQTFMQ